jgi:hypothetical protein
MKIFCSIKLSAFSSEAKYVIPSQKIMFLKKLSVKTKLALSKEPTGDILMQLALLS